MELSAAGAEFVRKVSKLRGAVRSGRKKLAGRRTTDGTAYSPSF
jgi:hypothetical protein